MLEWSELRGAAPRGFALIGSGTARVATARLFAPGAAVAATVRWRAGVRHELLRADQRGRVALTVALGPASKAQEYRKGARTRRHRRCVHLSARL